MSVKCSNLPSKKNCELLTWKTIMKKHINSVFRFSSLRLDVAVEIPQGWLGCRYLHPAFPRPVTDNRCSDLELAAQVDRPDWFQFERWYQRSLLGCETDYCCGEERKGEGWLVCVQLQQTITIVLYSKCCLLVLLHRKKCTQKCHTVVGYILKT